MISGDRSGCFLLFWWCVLVFMLLDVGKAVIDDA